MCHLDDWNHNLCCTPLPQSPRAPVVGGDRTDAAADGIYRPRELMHQHEVCFTVPDDGTITVDYGVGCVL